MKAYREVVRPAVTYNVDNKKTGARLQGFYQNGGGQLRLIILEPKIERQG